jgi:lipopolysaccharide transport system ATP-binding protein
MSDTVIRVEALSKRYQIGANRRLEGLRHTLEKSIRRGYQRLLGKKLPSTSTEDFWALKGVSFEVKRGECLGIVGRNGAGKSTLLKVLSRITQPTEGEIRIRGRLASLLEVGTGFHPELTGRENIFLNGAVLGMRRAEIRRKFDEIVAFAEVEKFLDTAVKYYSSGMYVRLAFAVAAHLEPEILIVDEVLAVGDAPFQKKCLGKIGEVAKQGRTALIVSHNMVAVSGLCQRAVHLKNGSLVGDGPSSEIIAKYMSTGAGNLSKAIWPTPAEGPGSDKLRLQSVTIVSRGLETSDVQITEDVNVEIGYWSMRAGLNVSASIHLLDKYGNCVLCSGVENIGSREGLHKTICTLPGNLLNTGRYSISVFLLTDVTRFEVNMPQAVSFDVYETGEGRGSYLGEIIGAVRVRLPWQSSMVEPLSANAGAIQEIAHV